MVNKVKWFRCWKQWPLNPFGHPKVETWRPCPTLILAVDPPKKLRSQVGFLRVERGERVGSTFPLQGHSRVSGRLGRVEVWNRARAIFFPTPDVQLPANWWVLWSPADWRYFDSQPGARMCNSPPIQTIKFTEVSRLEVQSLQIEHKPRL